MQCFEHTYGLSFTSYSCIVYAFHNEDIPLYLVTGKDFIALSLSTLIYSRKYIS